MKSAFVAILVLALAGSCAAIVLEPPVASPESSQPAPTINDKIKHIVVLMLENRSFDHMLGFLHKNNTDIDGCTTERAQTDAACTCPVDPTVDGSPRIPVENDAVYIQPADPEHDFVPTTAQIYGFSNDTSVDPAPMSGFIKSYTGVLGQNSTSGEFIMRCFDPTHVPVITTLGSEFAIIDHWFSGIPGPTEVNRAFANSGTSYGLVKNRDIIKQLGLPQRTVWENLDDAKQDWAVYFNDFPSTLLFRYTWGHLDKFHGWDKFLDDASEGKLPQYTWLEPRYYDDFGKAAQDEHPDHDVAEGEALIKQVYDTLRNSPTWNETLLLVTYDEHGGFFDHVPPLTGVPNPDGRYSADPFFNFTRIGIRVPAVVVSPWIDAGSVVHAPQPGTGAAFCHSSIPATVRKVFAPDQPALTRRTEWAATFDQLLTRDTPRTDCPTAMPTPPLHRVIAPHTLPALDGRMPLTDLQKFFVQMAAAGSGDEAFNPASMDTMTEGEGSRYVIDRINTAAGRTVIPQFLSVPN